MSSIRHQLADHPRVPLGHLPTPLHRLDRLSEALGGPEIWIKRDDATGLALGGNKTRKLEFLVADAREQGCDTLVTVGKAQSNHARQTAAAAAVAGMGCLLLLEELPVEMGAGYAATGNVLLDRLLDATIELVPTGANTPDAIEARVTELAESGARPYLIPAGGSNAIGALGYVDAMVELADQAVAADLDLDRVVLGTGSGGTQAGLLLGADALGLDVEILGVSVAADEPMQIARVADVAEPCAELLGRTSVDVDRIVVDDRFVGPGYAQPDDRTIESLRLFATLEGIVLDPVYTGKAAAGLIDGCRSGRFGADERIVFLHTGGQPAVFAYADLV